MTTVRPIFDATLRPNRSLSREGFRLLMIAFSVLCLIPGTIFFLAGAWPIVGFLGLDIALIYLAFCFSYRQARAHENVVLHDNELRVEKVDLHGRARSWSFEPYWARVEMDDPPEHDSPLAITSHGRRLVFGAFLSPEERLEFAKALGNALYKVKANLSHQP